MTATTCQCCARLVEVVDEDGLCFACETFHMFTVAIKKDTGLQNESALDLAGDLSGMVLSAIVERLQLPGGGQSLLNDLLEAMERHEKPN
jgi:hypothetical protein